MAIHIHRTIRPLPFCNIEVPVHKDEKLAKSLSLLDVGEYIPQELYSVVAEVLVYVDDMEKIQSKLGR